MGGLLCLCTTALVQAGFDTPLGPCFTTTLFPVMTCCVYQVITSAIGNEPPPPGVISALETSSMASTAMQVSSVNQEQQHGNGRAVQRTGGCVHVFAEAAPRGLYAGTWLCGW
jgi:hypothetical protein